MAEWALDSAAAKRYQQARNKLQDDLSALVAAPLWRNFFAKYPEANGLHKRMLIVSEELARRSILDASLEVRQAQQNLWRAQGNDVYWHGVFGGIYFPHLRADAYASLLKAERILSERRTAAGEQRDYDVDGYDEYIFRGNAGAVFVHVQGGAVIEWDIYASATNLVDTLARRPEAEHEALRRAEKSGKVLVGKAAEKETKSIHEAVRARERGLSKLLEYDAERRAFFQDSIRVGKGEPVVLHAYYYQLTPQREARTVSLILEPPPRSLASVPGLGIRKDIRIADEGLAAGVRYRLRNDGEEAISLQFTSSSNIGLLSEQNPADVITVGTRKTTAGKPIDARHVSEIAVHSESRHFDIAIAIDPPCEVTTRPIYSITNSEQGFERGYMQLATGSRSTVANGRDSVVAVITYAANGQPQSSGSGFVVDATKGYIITNNHVVEDPRTTAAGASFDVVFSDDKKTGAKLVGRDPFTDLAVLQVPAQGLKAATLANSDNVPVGALTVAIGSPLGEFQNTVTHGIVSAKGRRVAETSQVVLEDLIQTDAPINPGNSGGPLLWAATRQVIGVNTLGVTQATGINFAVSSNTVKQVADEIIANGKVVRGYLGIQYTPLTTRQAAQLGLATGTVGIVVSQVVPGSPAEQAGIQANDIITKVNDQVIDADHPLSSLLVKNRPGDKVKLTLIRSGKEMTVDVSLGQPPQ